MIHIDPKSPIPPYGDSYYTLPPNTSDERLQSTLESEKVELEKILRQIIIKKSFDDDELFKIRTKSEIVDFNAYIMGKKITIEQKSTILLELSCVVRGKLCLLELCSRANTRFCDYIPLFLDELETCNAKLKVYFPLKIFK